MIDTKLVAKRLAEKYGRDTLDRYRHTGRAYKNKIKENKMKHHGWESDSYRAGVLWVRAVVETARRLKKDNKYIIKRIDERVDELEQMVQQSG